MIRPDDSLKFLVIGAGGSGKTTLVDRLAQKGLIEGVFDTDREIRPGEVHGTHYNFVSTESYRAQRGDGNYVVGNTYGHRSYGLHRLEWERANLFVWTPAYLKQMPPRDRERAFAIYLCPPRDIREGRLRQRYGENEKDAIARLAQDDLDFWKFNDYDMIVENPNGIF